MVENAEYLIGFRSEADDDETSDWLLAVITNLFRAFRSAVTA